MLLDCTVLGCCTLFNVLVGVSGSPPLLQGDLRPDNAIGSLTVFEGKLNRLREERDNLIKAKEALELAEPGQ